MFKLIVLFTLLSPNAFSYPQFIGKGYTKCLTCHYNPFGNGPLNDYGRGVSAVAIAGRLFIPDSVTDETLGERSSFFFNNPSSWPISPSYDYRQLNFISNYGEKDESQMEIKMQNDFSLSSQFGSRKQFTATVTYGTLPTERRQLKDNDTYSREHYIGYRPTEKVGIYLGKMDKVFGIRSADHESPARKLTKNGIYDATHAALVHINTENFDLGLQYFIGDQQRDEDERSSGFSTKFEYLVTDRIKAGISFKSEEEKLESGQKFQDKSILAKAGIGKGSSILFEYGLSDSKLKTDGTANTSQFIFLQNFIYLRRGLYFMMTYDQKTSDISTSNEVHSLAPGINWFPMQRLEFRGEFKNTKVYDSNSITDDTWSFMGQVHLWL